MSPNPRITEWAGKRVWLVGASSGIGAAVARTLKDKGAILALSARREPPIAALLEGAAQGSLTIALDVTDAQAVQAASDRLHDAWGAIDLVVWLAATYTPMRAQTFDLDLARNTVEANIMGPLNGVAALLPRLLAARAGGIAFVSSVAGYRGLPKSLIYGPTKAALTNFAESLYLDLKREGIAVWVINPGFVETPLTAKNDFKMPALISPAQAAEQILHGFASGAFEIDFPKRFTRTLKVMRCLPYSLYFSAVSRAVDG